MSVQTVVTRAALILVASTLAACIVTAEQGDRMERDLQTLRTQVGSLRKLHEEDAARLTARASEFEGRLTEVTKRLAELDTSAHRGTTDVGLEVNQMRKELAGLRGDVEVMGFSVIKLQRATPPPAPPRPPEPVATAPAADPTGTPPPKAGDPPAPKEPPKGSDAPAPPKTKEEMLEQADRHLAGKKFDEALELFQTVRRKWPKAAGFGDRAQFGLCQALAGKGDHRKAIVECNKLSDEYPKGEFVDDALWQIASSFLAMDYIEDARAFLQELVDRHPKSPLADKAAKKIKELSKKKGK